jgi:hypothetical protein
MNPFWKNIYLNCARYSDLDRNLEAAMTQLQVLESIQGGKSLSLTIHKIF